MIDTRGVAVAAQTNVSATAIAITGIAPPGPQSWVLVVASIGGATFSVSSVTGGTGTFVKLGSVNSANRRLELWLGYNFGQSAPATVTVNRTAGTVTGAYAARTFDVLGDTSVAPAFAANAGTANAGSAAADSGSLTPAVGDLLVAAVVMASNVADSTARTHTGHAYLNNTGVESSATPLIRAEFGYAEALAAVASSEAWTLAASVEWAAIQVKITPPAPPTPTAALLLKGATTQAADAASPY